MFKRFRNALTVSFTLAVTLMLAVPISNPCNVNFEKWSFGWWGQVLTGCCSIFDDFTKNCGDRFLF
jgi:hypothetical protein